MGHESKANTLVGSAEAVQGLTELVSALPIGYLADKVWGKAKVVRLGGVLMIFTIGITLAALWDVNKHADENRHAASRSYYMLVVALGLWGIVNGISFGPSQALFSDSIPRGQRSELLTWLYTCYLLSSSIGPIVSIVLVLTVSSEAADWSVEEIYPVFFIGVCLEVPAAILMFFFSDKYAVPENDSDDESEQEEVIAAVTTPALNRAGSGEALEEPLLQNDQQEAERPQSNPSSQSIRRKGKAIIPYVLFFSSLVTALGSGASVKYFPLFFKEMGFNNAEVQGIFLIVPVFISGLSFVAQRLGKRLGRVEACFLINCVGVSLLYAMTWLSQTVGTGDSTLWKQRPAQAILIVVIYLFRTGVMNCSYPLFESILMDNVPSNQRARWKALESIASFGWTGSALLGGILSDTHSYQFTFSITATLQLCGGLMVLIIRPFVEAEEATAVDSAEETTEDSATATAAVEEQTTLGGSAENDIPMPSEP
jgi:MFS family permease